MIKVDFENMERGYGAVSVKAVKLITSGVIKNPSYAWDDVYLSKLNDDTKKNMLLDKDVR